MGWTKKQLISQAYEQIGLADYVYDLTSNELQSALRLMDSMIATWNGRGIRISFPLPSAPGSSDIDTILDIPDSANEAIYTNLAIRLAPSFGKAVPIELKESAKTAYQVIESLNAFPYEMQYPRTLPLGAGNKPWRIINDPFVRAPVNRLDQDLRWLTSPTIVTSN